MSEINDCTNEGEESMSPKKKFYSAEKGFIKNEGLYDLDSSQEMEMTNIRNEMDK